MKGWMKDVGKFVAIDNENVNVLSLFSQENVEIFLILHKDTQDASSKGIVTLF